MIESLRNVRTSASTCFLAFSLILLPPVSSHAAATGNLLKESPVHLGIVGDPEWEWFAESTPHADRLELTFDAENNETESTLMIRQDDVRQNWVVELNGERLGDLFLMEADVTHALSVPVGALRNGENRLTISTRDPGDDILLHSIRVLPVKVEDFLRESTIEVRVTDLESGEPIPCRITVADEHGSLMALDAERQPDAPAIAVRPGVVYTGGGGRVRIHLPSGRYTLYASRGFEWSVAGRELALALGDRRSLDFELKREVPTDGWVSCDTHIHTFTHSRHGDATLEERMATIAGEGIELPIATDHNLHIDYSVPSEAAHVDQYFTPLTGNEVTTAKGHFNIFPVDPSTRIPDFRITHWPALMEELRETPGVRVVILNHPRNVHNDFQPFGPEHFNPVTGENRRGFKFTFDAMEVLNSSAQQSDFMLVYRDWFALLNHGYRVTALGTSDSHDVSRYIVGQGRTYLACPDDRPGALPSDMAIDSLLNGRALVSMGLLARMTVNERFTVGDLAKTSDNTYRVKVDVYGPSWTQATNVALFANGELIGEEHLAANGNGGLKGTASWNLAKPAHDVHLVAIATGPGVEDPFWGIPRPYYPTSPRWIGRVIGSTNPIWLDADEDGQFTSARGYARNLIEQHGTDPGTVLPQLAGFDAAIAAQVAALLLDDGIDLRETPHARQIGRLPEPVRKGIDAWRASMR